MTQFDVLVARLEAMDEKLDRVIAEHARWLREQDTRLRSVERWVYALPPTLLFAAASIAVAVLR